MRLLGWILGVLVVLAALLALTGTEIRLRPMQQGPMAGDCCDGKCSPPTYCSRRSCKCEAGALTRDAAAPSPPHSDIYQADWPNPGQPRPFEQGGEH